MTDCWEARSAPPAACHTELPVVRTSTDETLLCPGCGDEWTHVERVQVSARGEDGRFDEITVDAITGAVNTHGPTPGPMGTIKGVGRRQRVALSGHCETCGHEFALAFTQHKGVTFVEWAAPSAPVYPSIGDAEALPVDGAAR